MAEIHGEADSVQRQVLGKVSKVFDVAWLQAFKSGNVTVQFIDKPDAQPELVRFMEMFGYDLDRVRDSDKGFCSYYFERVE